MTAAPTGLRWTDEFLDDLRLHGDPVSDDLYFQINTAGQARRISALFKLLADNDDLPPDDAFGPFKQFLADTNHLPPDADLARIERGERVFADHGLVGTLVLLTKSLPSGYGAPPLTKILHFSGVLEKRTYSRLLGVLQMVVDVSARGGFKPSGEAVITAQKLRLLHAGVRHIVRTNESMRGYEAQHGVPVNQEDMLGTIMGFSCLVIEGWRQLGAGVSAAEEEDYFLLWRVFCLMVGIRRDAIPHDVADAQAFYLAYEKRHMRTKGENPEGVALAKASLKMLRELMPRWMKLVGLDVAPQFYMNELMGRQGCERIGIDRVRSHRVVQALLRWLPGLGDHHVPIVGGLVRAVHEKVVSAILQGLIDGKYDGEPAFLVPTSVRDLWNLTSPEATEKRP